MTPQEKRQAVEARIREVVPSLQELSFGCRVLVRDCDGHEEEATYASGADYAGLVYSDGSTGSFVEDWLIQIIGHPIRYSHVLLALNKAWDAREEKDKVLRYEIETEVWGFLSWKEVEYTCGCCEPLVKSQFTADWDLSWDDLSHASDECIEFLHDVLISKE